VNFLYADGLAGESGPARRVYRLTRKGEEHLEEWAVVLQHLSRSMDRFVRDARKALKKKTASVRANAA